MTRTIPGDPAPSDSPRILAPFIIDRANDEQQELVLFRSYTLICRRCREARFTALQRRRNSIDVIGDAIVGLSLRCTRCDTVSPLFDARTDGYDGALGHNEMLAGASREEPLIESAGTPVPASRIQVTLTYNGDEYLEVAKDSGIRAIDLFDWFELQVLLNDEWVTVWDYECA